MKKFKLFIALMSLIALFGGTSCEDGGSSSGGEDGVYISDISSTRYPSSSTWRILDDSISTAQVKNFVSDLQQIRKDSPSKLIALDFVNVEEFYNVDGGIVVGTEYISKAYDFSGCDILASVTLSKAKYCGLEFRECPNLTTISLPCVSELGSLVLYDGKVVTKLAIGTSASGVPVNGNNLGLYNVTS